MPQRKLPFLHVEESTLPSPLTIPENYDAQAHMITHQVRGRIFHATIASAQLASELMARGTPADIAEAAAIFRAVLACQEVRETLTRIAAIFAGSWKTKSSKISMPCSLCSFTAFPCCAKHQTPCLRIWSRLCVVPSRWAWRKSRASTWP